MYGAIHTPRTVYKNATETVLIAFLNGWDGAFIGLFV